MSDPSYLNALKTFLAQRHPQPNPLWNYSENNSLAPDWLLATPTAVWGQPYKQFAQSVAGDTPGYPLRACSSADGAGQLCAAVPSSVTAPGQEPRKLLVGHSQQLCDALYETMTRAELLLDFTTLTPPTGLFLDAFRNAITYISNKPAAQRPAIRILFSNPIKDNLPFDMAAPFLQSITAQLDPAQAMTIYVTVMSSSFASWNHAKIVAADGRYALSGGHNMWGPDYLGQDPVFDVSMRLQGTAARHAQDYANNMWDYVAWRNAHLAHWVAQQVVDFDRRSHAAYLADPATGRCAIRAGVLPPPGFYASRCGDFPPPAAGSTAILAIGRGGNTRSSYLLPTLYSYAQPFDEPSDDALLQLVGQARTSIRMSLQAFLGPKLYNPTLFSAMVDAMQRGVNIDVVLSNPGAVPGGQRPIDALYNGDYPQVVNGLMRMSAMLRLKIGVSAAGQLVGQRLRVASFRYSADAAYPSGATIGNHAKTLMVDDRIFYIGSQNLYPANLNEFGWVVEDTQVAVAYIDQYWAPLWRASFPTMSQEFDPDVEVTQEAEAVEFQLSYEQNTRLAMVWDGLAQRRDGAANPADQAAIEQSMDELVVNAGFATTAAKVLQAQATPFFRQDPPDAGASSEAVRFVLNLMNSPQLMQQFAQVVDAASGSVQEANQRVTDFLHGKGYQCNALQVLAAFNDLRRRVLAYWVGNYSGWITADGGAAYTFNASRPSRKRATGAEPPLPDMGPQLAIANDGAVTFDGKAILKPRYDENCLSWSVDDGNDCAATLHFGTVTRPSLNDPFTGSECFGTVTWAAAAGARAAGTYSFYVRGPAGMSPQPTPGDKGFRTAGYVLSALTLAALAMLAGLFVLKQYKAWQERLERGRAKRAEDYSDTDDDDLVQVRSADRGAEFGELRRRVVRESWEAAQRTSGELVRYESAMSSEELADFTEASTRLRGVGPTLREAPVSQIESVLRQATTTIGGIRSKFSALFDNLKGGMEEDVQLEVRNRLEECDEGLRENEALLEQEAQDPPEIEI